MTGLILGLHANRPKGDFVVLLRVTGTEYPVINISRTISEFAKLTSSDGNPTYTTVWFITIKIPDLIL